MSGSQAYSRRAPLVGMMLLLLGFCAGCRDEDLETYYGMRSGIYAGQSVNGTAVLGDMFDRAGHSVGSRGYLSPKVGEADVIIWFQNDLTPPKKATRRWLEDWLDQGDRTMIYVGRDYDAEPDYWRDVVPRMPAGQQAEGKSRQTEAQQRVASYRQAVPDAADAEWFSIDGKATPRDVKQLSGPWAAGIDSAKTSVKLNSRVLPADNVEILLEDDQGDMLVSRRVWNPADDALFGHRYGIRAGDSKLIVVANGSFLLNYPLVNHEHRKLAGKLLGEVPNGARVVFLEGADPPIRDKDPEPEAPTGIEMFSIWPMNWILIHLGVLGAVFLLARWPIFGLPRSLPRDPQSDFGKHVAALGELLQRTRDRAFAIDRLQHYRQLTKKEAGMKLAPPPPAQSAVEKSEIRNTKGATEA